MAKKKSTINLLPQEEFDASILGRTLKWAMGSFRIIVIVTEMVVMAAFLSRFWLDAQNSSLDDSIKVASAQISAQSSFESEFRGIQAKLKIFKQIAAAPTESSKLDLISSKIPQNLLLSSISVQSSQAQVRGSATTETDVAQFIANLKSDPTIKSAELDSVGTSDQNTSTITFQINISY
jgi:Tfp pilus assembly protein PilN